MPVTPLPVDPVPWARRFALLSDPTRLALLIAIHDQPGLPVHDLADRAEITRNAASQALRNLRDQGWVTSDRDGRTVRYRLNPDAIVHRILHDIVGHHH